MRIGFDGKRVVQNFTGLGNYSRFILSLLSKHYPDTNYYIYSLKSGKAFANDAKLQFRHPSKTIFPALWRSFGILSNLKKDKINLYHGLSNELPFGIKSSKIPSVVTIHDLIFLRFPKFYPLIDRTIYRYKFKYACKNANRIIAVSEQTKKDIISFFKIAEEKIDVIYQGCNSIFKSKVSDEIKKKIKIKYELPNQYLLQVGTIEERKNLLLTVKALTAVAPDIKLLVIGKETEYLNEVKEYIFKNHMDHRIVFLKNVPLEDLPAIYQQAKIFIYPSEFEGFGIPVIEALYSGIPVIAAKGSCLEEAGGPTSCYIHPKDDIQLAYTINSILNDEEKQIKMINAGLKYVDNFAEERLAKNLMNVYKKVLNHA